MPAPLAVVGNVNVDLVMGPLTPWPRPGTEVFVDHSELRPGGAAGNVSLTWTGLGRDHQIAAHTGGDLFGTWLREAFAPLSDRWPVAEGATTLSVGLSHPDSERTFVTTPGHLAALSWPEVRAMLDWRRLAGGHLLVCGSFLMDALAADYPALFVEARAHGVGIALDTGWPPKGWTQACREEVFGWLSKCDLLLLNEAEAAALSGTSPGEAAAALLARMPAGAHVVIKRGANGARCEGGSGVSLELPAPEVAVVDSIGAGDVFNAGFLAALAEGRALEDCLEAAVRTASVAISTRPRRYGSRGHCA